MTLFECPIPDSRGILEAAVVTLPVAAPVDDAAVHPDLVGVLFAGMRDVHWVVLTRKCEAQFQPLI